MKKIWVPIIIGMAFLITPVIAMGASFTGSIQGFNCVTEGKICPIGKEDPVIAGESLFVLLIDAAKSDYYVIGNVNRGVLARRFNEQVKIDGKVDMKTKSIAASDLYVMGKNKQWVKTWSSNKFDSIYREMWSPAQ